MDEEEIGVVLARATELRLNITNCIHTATTSNGAMQEEEDEDGEEDEEEEKEEEEGEEEGEGGREMDRLLIIRHHLESIETRLSSLRAMHQNQKYEREAALVEIENSRKALLNKLSEYKGKDLEVIQEATVFASETVEEGSSLELLPESASPLLSRENGIPSNSSPTLKSALQNGDHTQKKKPDPGKNQGGGLGNRLAIAAKTVIALVGVVVILGFAGFGNKRKGMQFSPLGAMNSLWRPLRRDKAVVEDGETRCLVKERIEVPFESAVSAPDLYYGCS